MMEIMAINGKLFETIGDVLVLPIFQGEKGFHGIVKEIDEKLDRRLSKIKNEQRFTGKLGEVMWSRTEEKMTQRNVLLVGLGKQEEMDLEQVRLSVANAFQSIKLTTANRITTVLFGVGLKDFVAKDVAQAMTEGLRLSDYSFCRYKKEKKQHIKSIAIYCDRNEFVSVQKGIQQGELFAKGTCVARDLVNTPGLHMSPSDLVNTAKNICKGKSGVRMRVFDQLKLEKMGAGGILGVSKGSDHPPFMVHMTYTPKKKSKKCIVLVGKGVTFDSGGISIKPADYMMTMKCDMAGAADVIGVFSVLSELSPNVEVHGIFVAVENMPSGCALRPGDVIEIMNKKTVEVLNTDAEGRLILADALVYASRLKPDIIIDLATLTGACVVALGEEISGVMSNTPLLANKILNAASLTGEKMWELPLEKKYRKLILGDISDYKNIGGRWGGTLTAGLFLQEFVNKLPWAHLDIAGPAFAERDLDVINKKGATGHGVRTLLSFLQSN